MLLRVLTESLAVRKLGQLVQVVRDVITTGYDEDILATSLLEQLLLDLVAQDLLLDVLAVPAYEEFVSAVVDGEGDRVLKVTHVVLKPGTGVQDQDLPS